jgi:hypothetical protein
MTDMKYLVWRVKELMHLALGGSRAKILPMTPLRRTA